MKKRLLAGLMAMCLVLTLLPASALAAEGNSDTEGQIQKLSATEQLQARINALPSVEEVSTMEAANRDAAYLEACEIEDAVINLNEDEQAALDTSKMDALLQWFTEQTTVQPGDIEDNQKTASGNCGTINSESSVNWTLTSSEEGYTLTISGSGAMADYNGATDTPWYKYLSENSGLITDYNGRSFANIPKIVVDSGVIRIGDNAFAFTTVSEIEIADSVESIGNGAFLWDCWLKEIAIPASVTNMHYSEVDGGITYYNPFNGAFNLERMVIQGAGSPYQIVQGGILLGPVANQSGEWMVINCPDNLGSGTAVVTSDFPNNTTKIGTNSFNGCRDLTAIELPDTITSIDSWAFSKCYSLKSFDVPENVTVIPDHAFTGCAALKTIDLNNVKTIGEYAFDQVQASEGDNESYKVGLTSIDLTNVERIEKYAFYNAQLTSVDLPDDITLDNYAFVDCEDLKVIHFWGDFTVEAAEPSGSEDPFVRCDAIETVTFANNSTVDISSNIFQDCTEIKKIDLSNVKLVDNAIGNSAFSGCTGLEEVLLPEGVTRIEWRAFYDTSLSSITLPSTVGYIAQGAFGNETEGKIISTINASAIEAITTGDVSDHPFVDGEKVIFYFGNQTVADKLEKEIVPYGGSWSGTVGITNGGTFVEETNFMSSALSSPVKDGYAFEGWYPKDGSVNGEWGEIVTTPQAGNTYYAKWEEAEAGYDIEAGQENIVLNMTSGESGVSTVVDVEVPTGGSINNVEVSDSDVLTATFDGNTVTITPKSGLAAGTYKETVYAFAEDGSTHWIQVELTVEAEPEPIPDPDPEPEPTPDSEPSDPGSSSGGSTSVRRYNIEADAGRGGDISPDGRVRVRRGENQTFRITADDGWEIADVEVDGESVGAVERYTFENVRTDHTISATFRQIVTEPEEPQTPALPFTDVAEGDWYYDAVAYCWENGIMDGTSGTAFAPNMLLNRAMMAQVLYNLADGTASTVAGFPDVAASAWYADAVNWAAANGYVTGYDNGSYGPEDNLTREQLAVILYRYAGSPAPAGSLDGFADAASASAYAVDALRWAVGEGLLTGKDGGRLDPTGTASRAELAQILARFAG